MEEDFNHEDFWEEYAISEKAHQKEIAIKKRRLMKSIKAEIDTRKLKRTLSEFDWDIVGISDMVISGEYAKSIDFPKTPKMKVQLEFDSGHPTGVIYLWQTCGMAGDDYFGYEAFPLQSGRYLIIKYSC